MRHSRRAFLRAAAASSAYVALSACTSAPTAKRIPRLGYLGVYPAPDPALTPFLDAFVDGLRQLGYEDGKSIQIEWQGGPDERWDAIAADFVRLPVDVIAGASIVAIRAALRATRTIPVVMTLGSDPIESGLAQTLARPGGNLTGMGVLTSVTAVKRLELLKEAFPGITRVAMLGDTDPVRARQFSATEDASRTLRLEPIRLEVSVANVAADLQRAFDTATSRDADALLVLAVPSQISGLRRQIVAYAASRRIPAAYATVGGFVEDGGLLGYGDNGLESFRRAASFVDRILKGASPAELPIEQPTKFDLVVNLKTARAFGFTIPQTILSRATQVIQ